MSRFNYRSQRVVKRKEIVDGIMAGSFVIRQSKHLALVLQRIIEVADITKSTDWQNARMNIEATAHCALVQWNAVKESRPHTAWREAPDRQSVIPSGQRIGNQI